MTREFLYEVLVNNKEKGALGYKAKYSFKWIPDLRNTTTPLGDSNEERRKISGAFGRGALERTALINLFIIMFGVSCTAYAGVHVAQRFGLVQAVARYSRLALMYASTRMSAKA
jgi:hypothetical protein